MGLEDLKGCTNNLESNKYEYAGIDEQKGGGKQKLYVFYARE